MTVNGTDARVQGLGGSTGSGLPDGLVDQLMAVEF